MGKAIVINDVDFSRSGLGIITPMEDVPLVSLRIIGNSEVSMSEKYTVTLFPNNTKYRGVVWSIVEGAEFATIDQTGTVFVNENVHDEVVKLRVTSKFYPEIYDEKLITVSNDAVLLFNQPMVGDTSSAITTEFYLFSSAFTEWTLYMYVPDCPSASGQRCAVHCMNEATPYPGVVRQAQSNKKAVETEVRDGTNNRYYDKVNKVFTTVSTNRAVENSETPVIVSRKNDALYYSNDGLEYTQITGVGIPNIPTISLTVGAKNTNGTLSQPFNSGGKNVRVILTDKAFSNLSNYVSDDVG